MIFFSYPPSLKLTGGTLTGPLVLSSVSVPAATGRLSFSNAAPASPTGEYLVKIAPDQTVAPGNKNFNLTACTFGNGFGARNNVHVKFGYNIAKTSTGAEDTTDPATCLAFESYYRPVGDIFTEGYFQCWPIGGGAELTRPFMYNFRHSDNFITTYLGGDDLQIVRGSTGGLLARIVAANYALVLYDSSANQRVILDAANGKVQVNANGSISSPLIRGFHAEGTSPGVSFWDTGGAADEKLWDFYAAGGVLQLRAVNDAAGAANNILQFSRSGATPTAISFGAGLVSLANYRFAHGTAALAANATEGFMHFQSCAGLPTGTPASIPSGQKPVVINSITGQINIYDGAWTALPKTLNVNVTAVGNVGGGTDDLMTYTVPANVLVANGKAIRIKAWGTTANNATGKTVTFVVGSQTVLTTALTTSIAGRWEIEVYIVRTGTNSQDIMARLLQGATLIYDQELTAGTQTESGTITVKATGAAGANDDIVQEGMITEIIN